MVSSQQLIARYFLIFNRSLTITQRRTARILFTVETENKFILKKF